MQYLLKLSLTLSLVIVIIGCREQSNEADAYGSFEATTMNIGSEIGGKLVRLNAREGETYPEGKIIGWTDTGRLYLQKAQLRAKKLSVRSNLDEIKARLSVFNAQIDQLNQEIERFKPLLETGGASRKQVDDLQNELKIIKRKKAATASKVSRIRSEVNTIEQQIAQVKDKIDKCRITMPTKGTVLDLLKEKGEIVAPGSPVLRLAKLDHLEFKAFITGTQLPKVKPGQKVTVRIDKDENAYHTFPGKIARIAEEAEFSPKNIKTKEERANLVYAIKIRVKNDGKLKIGMPGEVMFEAKSN